MRISVNMKSGREISCGGTVEQMKQLVECFMSGAEIIRFSAGNSKTDFENIIRSSEIESILWVSDKE